MVGLEDNVTGGNPPSYIYISWFISSEHQLKINYSKEFEFKFRSIGYDKFSSGEIG
jgi:hypothetical protein